MHQKGESSKSRQVAGPGHPASLGLPACSDSHQTRAQLKGTPHKSIWRRNPKGGKKIRKNNSPPKVELGSASGVWNQNKQSVTKRITNRFVVICSPITNASLTAPPHFLASCRRSTSIQRVTAGSTCLATVSSVAKTRNGMASWAPPSVPHAELFQILLKSRSHPMWTLTKPPRVMGAPSSGTWVTRRSKASVIRMDEHCLDKAKKSDTGRTWCVF